MAKEANAASNSTLLVSSVTYAIHTCSHSDVYDHGGIIRVVFFYA